MASIFFSWDQVTVTIIYICFNYRYFIFPIHKTCVQAVRSSAELSYEEGMKRERDLFLQLGQSGQSKAQQYAFFAERAVSKVDNS